jgi:hypothetical protein
MPAGEPAALAESAAVAATEFPPAVPAQEINIAGKSTPSIFFNITTPLRQKPPNREKNRLSTSDLVPPIHPI